MRGKIASLGVFFILLLAGVSWGQVGEDYLIELEGRYWRPRLDGTVRIVEQGGGTDVDLVRDTGLEERKDFGEGRLQIKFARRHKLQLSYLPLSWDGDRIISRTFQFSGQTFSAGTRVQTNLDLKFFQAGYEYDFLTGGWGFLGGTLDALLADADVEIKTPGTPITAAERKTVPVPLIGLKGRFYPVKWVNLNASISGLPLGGYGHVLNMEASVGLNPIENLGISGGYRYFKTKLQYDDNRLDFKLDGPFLGLEIRF